MKAKQLIKKLEDIVSQQGNCDVMFDTEAMCFDVHLVGIEKVNFVSGEESGDNKPLIVMNFDFAKEPIHANFQGEQ